MTVDKAVCDRTQPCKCRSNKETAIKIPGAHREKDDIEDDDGQGAPMLSFKSQVKLYPVALSTTTSVGKLRSKQPALSRKLSDKGRLQPSE